MEYKAKCAKEGQPHYGCGICNVRPFLAPPTTTNPSTTDWREEFDQKFSEHFMTRDESYDQGVRFKDIKDFIESLLSRKEEEVRKEYEQKYEQEKD